MSFPSLEISSGVSGSALHVHKAVPRHELEHDLRVWHLRRCREHSDPAGPSYFQGRREARCWFKKLCNNQDFQHVVATLRSERDALSRTISLVGWLKDAQQTVDNQVIPYKRSGRLSQLDKLNADGGLREPLFREIDERLPRTITRRSTTIAGLADFLGVPSTGKEVVTALRRHGQTSPAPSKPSGAIEITRLLQSWEAPENNA